LTEQDIGNHIYNNSDVSDDEFSDDELFISLIYHGIFLYI